MNYAEAWSAVSKASFMWSERDRSYDDGQGGVPNKTLELPRFLKPQDFKPAFIFLWNKSTLHSMTDFHSLIISHLIKTLSFNSAKPSSWHHRQLIKLNLIHFELLFIFRPKISISFKWIHLNIFPQMLCRWEWLKVEMWKQTNLLQGKTLLALAWILIVNAGLKESLVF